MISLVFGVVGFLVWWVIGGTSISQAGVNPHPHTAGRCLSVHMEEAMAINTARQPVYSRMTKGASQGVSKTLILSEGLAHPMARMMEWWAQPLVELGVDIFCDVVVSMEGSPPLVVAPETYEYPETQVSQERFNPWKGADRLSSYLWYGITGNDRKLAEELSAQLTQLNEDALLPLHCMQRHLLESVIRAVNWAPEHRQSSRRVGLGFRGSALVQINIISQIGLLPLGFWLDYQAAPIQQRGVPLICGDVPPIPAH